MEEAASAIFVSLDPYEKGLRAKKIVREASVRLGWLVYKTVIANRLKYPEQPGAFYPAPYLEEERGPTLSLA